MNTTEMEITTPVEENLSGEFSFDEVLQNLRLSSSEKSYTAPQLPDDAIMEYEKELENLVEHSAKNSMHENNLEDVKGNNSSDSDEESNDTFYFSFENSSKEESDVDETKTSPDPCVDFEKLFEEQKERHEKELQERRKRREQLRAQVENRMLPRKENN